MYVQLQQQLAALEYKLQQAESSQGSVKQPLQEQQLPENLSGKAPQKPEMAEAVADALHRPHWQNPMAVHLSEAEKAEVHMVAEVAGNQSLADENGAPQSLLAGHPGLLQWEEKKKLQKRIDQLRAKLKVCLYTGAMMQYTRNVSVCSTPLSSVYALLGVSSKHCNRAFLPDILQLGTSSPCIAKPLTQSN